MQAEVGGRSNRRIIALMLKVKVVEGLVVVAVLAVVAAEEHVEVGAVAVDEGVEAVSREVITLVSSNRQPWDTQRQPTSQTCMIIL